MNLFNNGYYQGDVLVFLEVVIVCIGIYGIGVYFGNLGQLVVDFIMSVSYNVQGVGIRKYLLFVLWDFVILICMFVL